MELDLLTAVAPVPNRKEVIQMELELPTSVAPVPNREEVIQMEHGLPASTLTIQDSRCVRKDGSQIDDISLCSSGDTAVSGHCGYPHCQSFVCIYRSSDDYSDSRDKPTLLYHKQFTPKKPLWLPRYISFLKPNSTEIVTCRDHEVQVVDYNQDVVLRSRKVNGETRCLSASESRIFIGFFESDIVNIYDNDLNRINSIRLKGIGGDWPWEIVAAAGRLHVCTVRYDRAIVYSQYSGNILKEYKTGQDSSKAYSIAVNKQLRIVAVLWNWTRVSVYSFSNHHCLVDFDVECGITRIRISDQSRMVTARDYTSDVRIFDLHSATLRPREVDADTIAPDEHSVMPLPGRSKSPTVKGLVEKHLEEHSAITGRREIDAEVQPSIETKAVITKKGGVLEISSTGVVLQIPPYALPDDKEYCTIHMRIIPRDSMTETGTTFSSNSSTVVELLPNNLRFQCPVRLSLPHCLVLDGTKVRQARIFLSHHKKGSKPQWEEQPHLSYHLEDTSCIILLDSFSWVKFSVDDEIVTAKKIIVYSAVRRIYPKDTVAEIRIGYYLDLPDEKMVEADTTDITVVHRKTFFFVRGEKHPLRVSLDETLPSVWQYKSPKPPLREIPYRQISSLSKHSVIYTLHKEAGMMGDLLCVFTVSQEKGQVPVQLAAHLQVLQKDSLSEQSKDSPNTSRNSFAAEKSINRNGGTVTIPNSGVQLELPPDAIEENCLIRIKITPNRVLEDNVTSFCSSSCTAVEISPCNFPLSCSAKLSLPHCLMLKEKKKTKKTKKTKKKECKARIFVNEEEGTPSLWKEQGDLRYELKNGVCIVHLEKLCCVRFSIDNDAVEGKRIVLYPAAKSLKENDDLAVVEVGYYSDIPGGQELLRLNPHLKDGPKANYIFMEKQKLALQLLLNDVNPPSWKCRIPYENPQEIPFKTIASSMEHSHLYILQKESDHAGSVICEFTASQKDSPFSSEISMRLNPQEDHSNGNEQPSLNKAGAESKITVFQFLSKNLGDEWLDVGKNLGLEDAELSHIKADYPNRRKEAIYQMLLYWKQTRGSTATHYDLIKALDQSKRKDLAEKVLQDAN